MPPSIRCIKAHVALLLSLFLSLTCNAAPRAPADWVDPLLGTLGDGNVFPGASLPFGFIQASPDTGMGSKAGGYKFDRPIEGFSQQHISGMGGPLFGHVALMPVTGPLATPGRLASTAKSDESASPGYYTVTLQPWNVKAELTSGRRTAVHRYTFPAHQDAKIVVDAGHVLYGAASNWGSAVPVGGEVRIDPARREVEGHMSYQGARSETRRWKVYFVVRFDTALDGFGSWGDAAVAEDRVAARSGKEIGVWAGFATRAGQAVQARVALSYHGVEQARAYLDQEAAQGGFDQVRQAARAAWNEALGRVEVEGGTDAQRTQFYTALYRMQLTPNDWTGESPARYGKLRYYENLLCMWDTFRTVNPMLTLIRPDVQADIVNSILAWYRHDGWTGDSHSAWSYEHVQNGSNADVIIADAYAKQLPGIDWKLAYQAVRKNAFVDPDPAAQRRLDVGRLRLSDYRRHGYLPADATPAYDDLQSVSRTLEYVHNDFAVLSLARRYGNAAEVAELEQRQFGYARLWDKETGFMRARLADGAWFTPFDPLLTETGRQYYEGHAWTWSWYVPHDNQGLIRLHGGPAPFIAKLTTAVEHHYQAWNEPGMLQTYLFIHAGRPDLTQRYVRRALGHFATGPAGLPGNDDSGTTSAWLLWSMLGLYPHAGEDYYYVGSPVFSRATIKLGNGKRIVIEAPATSAERLYIAGATLNGKPLRQAWLRHGDLIGGATLRLDMGAQPSDWGRRAPVPPSVSSPAAP